MLAITLGEPAGIGPDIVVKLAQESRKEEWVVFGDADALAARAALLGCVLDIKEPGAPGITAPHACAVHHVPLSVTCVPSKPDPRNARSVLRALDAAIEGCMRAEYGALVTGPMQKSVVNEAGIVFTGHTEYLCEQCGSEDVVMLLAAGDLRVALATTHLPLASVSAALTTDLLTRRLRLLHADLASKFGLSRPRIVVTGLNPHAGENGHLGHEEGQTIAPVCRALRAEGLEVLGPVPADTAFTPERLRTADAVMVMYHDQGLPVLKYAGFGRAVNVTLGLPIIRTSVDHGTGLDIVGTGRVDTGSMAAAIDMASELAVKTQQRAS